jgi:hypothetical protein
VVGTGALTLKAGGTNQNLTLGPSGTGGVIVTSSQLPTAGRNTLSLDNTNGTNLASILNFNSNGTSKWQFGNDVTANGANNFFVSDVVNGFVRLYLGGGVLGVISTDKFGWASGTAAPFTFDTGLARNAAGVVEVNNGTSGTLATLKAAIVNTTTSHQFNGSTSGITTLQSMAIAGTGTITLPMQGNLVASNGVITSTVDQTATAETVHVIYTVPANTCTIGTSFRLQAWGNIDNGTTAITYTPTLRWGGTGGVSLLALPTIVSTTTALTNKTWEIEALVTIRSIGATGTAVAQMGINNHTAQASGANSQDDSNSGATAVTIDTTANKDLDLTWIMNVNTGTPHVRTLGGWWEIVKN